MRKIVFREELEVDTTFRKKGAWLFVNTGAYRLKVKRRRRWGRSRETWILVTSIQCKEATG